VTIPYSAKESESVNYGKDALERKYYEIALPTVAQVVRNESFQLSEFRWGMVGDPAYFVNDKCIPEINDEAVPDDGKGRDHGLLDLRTLSMRSGKGGCDDWEDSPTPKCKCIDTSDITGGCYNTSPLTLINPRNANLQEEFDEVQGDNLICI
jgi:hypothetical protein